MVRPGIEVEFACTHGGATMVDSQVVRLLPATDNDPALFIVFGAHGSEVVVGYADARFQAPSPVDEPVLQLLTQCFVCGIFTEVY